MRRQLQLQYVRLALQHRLHLLDRFVHQRAQVERSAVDLDEPAADPRCIEQVIDESAHVAHLTGDHGAGVGHARRRGARSPQHFGGHRDRGQRVAQFVGQHGQKLVLVGVGALQRLLGQHALADVERHHHRAIDGPV